MYDRKLFSVFVVTVSRFFSISTSMRGNYNQSSLFSITIYNGTEKTYIYNNKYKIDINIYIIIQYIQQRHGCMTA